MKFHVLTLFPEMIMQGLGTSIIGRAASAGTISLDAVNIRDYSMDKHKKVDDYTYGGGAGMLMQAQPVFDAWKAVCKGQKVRCVYLTPQGTPFTQQIAQDLAKEEELIFLCGHYEGIDERVLEEIVTDYVSIGDYVLTGGELPAMVMIDAISRLVPGVLNNESSAETESFQGNLLEYPQYSRPEVWHDKQVPEVLLSGDHNKIRQWRLEQSVERTKQRRPDLFQRYERNLKCIEQLKKDKLSHIEMIEVIRRGKARLIYFKKDGVLLQDIESGYFMATATNEQGAEQIVNSLKEEMSDAAKAPSYIVAHQDFLKELIAFEFDYDVLMECKQAVYTRKEVLPIKKVVADKYQFRNLTLEELPIVSEIYSYGDEESMKERIQKKALFGLYQEDSLCGFIGIHPDGSLGMLEVMPEYRRNGIGSLLECYLINYALKQGWTPFGQVDVTNLASWKLQEKLGLCLSKNSLWWLEKKSSK
ncbi:MAG: tRNA (guanosine(37)-N1)-methyltransferase TrmD [Lachnospiraceae bacterium]|nr:tRNA (guanosine(37)-N1)-methyltransferase TrmD [Lachnospiraceae bacterium]